MHAKIISIGYTKLTHSAPGKLVNTNRGHRNRSKQPLVIYCLCLGHNSPWQPSRSPCACSPGMRAPLNEPNFLERSNTPQVKQTVKGATTQQTHVKHRGGAAQQHSIGIAAISRRALGRGTRARFNGLAFLQHTPPIRNTVFIEWQVRQDATLFR